MFGDSRVLTGEGVALIVVCRTTLMLRKKKRAKAERRLKCWKLKKDDCCEDLSKRLRQALGGWEELPDDG